MSRIDRIDRMIPLLIAVIAVSYALSEQWMAVTQAAIAGVSLGAKLERWSNRRAPS